MKYLSLTLKGFIIGIGKIIPGVSGALMAISLYVYEKGIEAISTFFKNPKKNFCFLLPLGIGIIFGVTVFSKIIISFLYNYYLGTMLLFIGLIIGGLGGIKKEINFKNKNNILIILMILIISILFSRVDAITNNEYNFFIIVIMGFIEALTMIVPGISGTAVLMCLGYYNLIMVSFSNFDLKVLFPLSLGLIIGTFIITKVINFFFNNYKEKTYIVIFSFSLSSIILMFLLTLNQNYDIFEIIIGLILMIIGYYITKRIEK